MPKRIDSRDKGNRYERKIAKLLSTWWGQDFRRTPLSGGWDRQKAPGDIIVPDDFPWTIECKARQGWDLLDLVLPATKADGPMRWWEHLRDVDCRPGKMPMLVMTRRRLPDLVLLDTAGMRYVYDRCGVASLPTRASLPKPMASLVLLSDLVQLDAEALRLRPHGGTC